MKTLLLSSSHSGVGALETRMHVAPELLEDPTELPSIVALMRQERDKRAKERGPLPTLTPWTEDLFLLEHDDPSRAFMEGWEPIKLDIPPELG